MKNRLLRDIKQTVTGNHTYNTEGKERKAQGVCEERLQQDLVCLEH